MFQNFPAIKRISSIIILFTCSIVLVYCSSDSPESEEGMATNSSQQTPSEVPELADAMGVLQQYTHKFALAVEAENQELANFYFHEIEASIERIKEEVPAYGGYDIRQFMKMFIDPTIEPVEEALQSQDWKDVREKTITMINTCNSCHNATGYGFIQVTPGFDNNPFNQEFGNRE